MKCVSDVVCCTKLAPRYVWDNTPLDTPEAVPEEKKEEEPKGGGKKKKKFKRPMGRARFMHAVEEAPKRIKDDFKPAEDFVYPPSPAGATPMMHPAFHHYARSSGQMAPTTLTLLSSEASASAGPEAESKLEEERQRELESREKFFYCAPKGKRILFFDGKLKRISEINTAEETFRVVFHYYLTWLAKEEEVEEYFTAQWHPKEKYREYNPDFHPRLHFNNYVDGEYDQVAPIAMKEGYSYKNGMKKRCKYGWDEMKTSWDIPGDVIGFDPRRAYWLRVQYECDIVCAEELELDFFPFDCQDFGIHMRAPSKADKCDVLPLPRVGSFFSVDAKYSMVSEWLIPGVAVEFNVSSPEASKLGIPYAEMSLRIKAERKWKSHVQLIAVTVCMFCLGIGTFAIDRKDVGDRLAYGITLLLADVEAIQVAFDTMPNIPYETFMDSYMYTCFVYLVLVTAWSAIAGWGSDGFVPAAVDVIMFLVFVLGFVAIHWYFIRRLYLFRRVERMKLIMCGDELDKFFQGKNMDSLSEVPFCNINWDQDDVPTTKSNWSVKDFPPKHTDT